ncbi:hypothetical protein Cabys_2339 [Caldithrix abyssi DSM 13497]|uniref:Uncharacterized protein n=1 Tax=Caldithrix abyssi DSM 13497 TaxID=880073 RepID=A0A1J1CAZ8_CALAY|nr:hypothetical protein Cabys_2339 [Caldithrix abyssi DSM 13497]
MSIQPFNHSTIQPIKHFRIKKIFASRHGEWRDRSYEGNFLLKINYLVD